MSAAVTRDIMAQPQSPHSLTFCEYVRVMLTVQCYCAFFLEVSLSADFLTLLLRNVQKLDVEIVGRKCARTVGNG